jgi:phytoene dehydrogenase-like protein
LFSSRAPRPEGPLDAYADRLTELYDAVAPNFKSSVIARDVGPYEIAGVALIGGNIFHGEPSLEQLFHLWPAPGYADHRTRRQIPRMWLAGFPG